MNLTSSRAAQAGDRRDVDDAALAPRDHAGLAHRLAHQEDAADVQVHHLVPGFERVVLGRRAPGGAGVVDQDVDLAQALHRLVADLLDLRRVAGVGGHPARVDALGLQVRGGLFQVGRLARGEQDLRAGLAQALGDLQPQAARAAGDERRSCRSGRRVSGRGAHGVSPSSREGEGVIRCGASAPRSARRRPPSGAPPPMHQRPADGQVVLHEPDAQAGDEQAGVDQHPDQLVDACRCFMLRTSRRCMSRHTASRAATASSQASIFGSS